MEDNLKILKVEYLSNHWSDLSQIWNLSSGDQNKPNSKMRKTKMTSNGRRPQNINSWISQQPLTDLPQIWDLSSEDQTKIKKPQKEDDLQ